MTAIFAGGTGSAAPAT